MSRFEGRLGGQDQMLAGLAGVATVLVVPVVVVAGDFRAWMALALAIAAAMVATRQDSPHALAALGIIALVWIGARPDDLTPWSLVIALLMFTIHVALAFRTTAPPQATVDRTAVARWLGRCALVVALTGLVYLAALALRNLDRSDAEGVLAVAFALLSGLILVLRHETLGDQDARTGP